LQFWTNITDALHEDIHAFMITSRNVRDRYKESSTVRETGAVVNYINMTLHNTRSILREGKVVITFIFIKYVFYDAEEHGVCCEKRVKAN
jgi:hypothetical protein